MKKLLFLLTAVCTLNSISHTTEAGFFNVYQYDKDIFNPQTEKIQTFHTIVINNLEENITTLTENQRIAFNKYKTAFHAYITHVNLVKTSGYLISNKKYKAFLRDAKLFDTAYQEFTAMF